MKNQIIYPKKTLEGFRKYECGGEEWLNTEVLWKLWIRKVIFSHPLPTQHSQMRSHPEPLEHTWCPFWVNWREETLNPETELLLRTQVRHLMGKGDMVNFGMNFYTLRPFSPFISSALAATPTPSPERWEASWSAHEKMSWYSESPSGLIKSPWDHITWKALNWAAPALTPPHTLTPEFPIHSSVSAWVLILYFVLTLERQI